MRAVSDRVTLPVDRSALASIRNALDMLPAAGPGPAPVARARALAVLELLNAAADEALDAERRGEVRYLNVLTGQIETAAPGEPVKLGGSVPVIAEGPGQ